MKFLKIWNGRVTHINFKCMRCGKCCSFKDDVIITLNADDLRRISQHLGISVEEFMVSYCDWINDDILSLKPKDDYCIFFDNENKLCKINDVKPQQCASFPMWQILIDRPYHEEMQRYMKFCKGFGKAGAYTKVKGDHNWSPSDIIRKETED